MTRFDHGGQVTASGRAPNRAICPVYGAKVLFQKRKDEKLMTRLDSSPDTLPDIISHNPDRPHIRFIGTQTYG